MNVDPEAAGDPFSQGRACGPVGALLAELTRLSVNGRVPRSVYVEAVTAAALPARHYAQLGSAMRDAGLEVVEDDSLTGYDLADDVETGGEDDEAVDRGWDVVGYDHFLKQNWHRVLDPSEERDLAVAMQQGRLAELALEEGNPPEHVRRDLSRRARAGRRAEEKLVRHNLRLVAKITWTQKGHAGPALEIEDLFQEGVLGLITALSKFDPSKGFKLSTYATWWIRQRIARAVADKQRSIRLPVHKWEETRRVWRTAESLRSQGRPATPAAIAKALDMKVTSVRECQQIGQPLDSLDRRVAGAKVSVGRGLPDPNGRDPADLIEAKGLEEEIYKVLGELSERERDVLLLRHGFVDGRPRTLEEVGQEFGVTRERIRQIEAKTLAKLRNPHRIRALLAFVDFTDDLDAKRVKDEERRINRAAAKEKFKKGAR